MAANLHPNESPEKVLKLILNIVEEWTIAKCLSHEVNDKYNPVVAEDMKWEVEL